MNEVNILALALTSSNSADSLEALKATLSEKHFEQIDEAVGVLRALSRHLVDDWLNQHLYVEN